MRVHLFPCLQCLPSSLKDFFLLRHRCLSWALFLIHDWTSFPCVMPAALLDLGWGQSLCFGREGHVFLHLRIDKECCSVIFVHLELCLGLSFNLLQECPMSCFGPLCIVDIPCSRHPSRYLPAFQLMCQFPTSVSHAVTCFPAEFSESLVQSSNLAIDFLLVVEQVCHSHRPWFGHWNTKYLLPVLDCHASFVVPAPLAFG